MRIVSFFAVVLLLAGIALREQGEPSTPVCFQVTGGQAMTVKGTYWAEELGNTIREVAALADDAITEETFNEYRHRLAKNVLRLWWKSFWAAGNGKPLDPQIIQLREEQKQAEADAAQKCAADLSDLCAPAVGAPDDPATEPSVNPAAITSGSRLTGPDLAADALRKAGFPANEIPTFVAVAEHETGFRNISGPTVGGGTMRGMWQLNDRYWKLPNWQDPYANAVMAKKVRDESVAAGRSAWYPWSTWRAAVRDAGKYARFGNGTTAAMPAEPPEAECTVNGGVGVTIGVWNTAQKNHQLHNSSANINRNAGFASLVGLQEIVHNDSIHVPGYAMTEGNMAVPIIWDTSKLEPVPSPGLPNGWKREDTLNGSVHKSVVYGVWRNKATGETFGAINTHQYVNGGGRWAAQARKVNAVRKELQALGIPVVLMGDMNAMADKVAAFFGSAGDGGRIDRIVGYGLGPAKMEQLSKAGSDHYRRRATFPSKKAPSSPTAPSPAGWDKLNPKTPAEAVATLRAMMPSQTFGNDFAIKGHCEGYMNRAYGRNGGYPSAVAHWRAAGPKNHGTPPLGALVFFDTSNQYGHVAMSSGNGRVISTDYDPSSKRYRANVIGEGTLAEVSRAMGGRVLGWRAPNFIQGSGA